MYPETISDIDASTATRITGLWNDVISNMLTGLREDLEYFEIEGTYGSEDMTALAQLERDLYRFDSGEQHGEPSEILDAVENWITYYFQAAETPKGMNLAPVYRVAAELSDASATLQRARLAADPADPWGGPGVRVFHRGDGWTLPSLSPDVQDCTSNHFRQQDGRPVCAETAVWKVVQHHQTGLSLSFYCDSDLLARHRHLTVASA